MGIVNIWSNFKQIINNILTELIEDFVKIYNKLNILILFKIQDKFIQPLNSNFLLIKYIFGYSHITSFQNTSTYKTTKTFT